MKKRPLLSVLLAVLFLAGLSPCALAAVPDRPDNKYVLDSAGVLSSATEEMIVRENQALFDQCGAEVVVVAVDFFGGKSREDYAYELFNDWGIGSSERDNGILLLLGIGEDDYYAQAGSGIEDYFDGALLGDMLYEYLEEDFAAGDYDAGVRKVFGAVTDELESYYAGSSANQPGGEPAPDSWDDSRENGHGGARTLVTVVFALVRVAVVVAVLLLVFRLLRGIGRGGGPGPRSGGGGGGFWQGMFLGSMMNNRRPRRYWSPPPPPPPGPGPRPGGFGGFGGMGGFGGRPGGFSGGGRSHGGGAGRGGFGGGGFHGGGSSRGGGAGRR